MKQQSTQTNPIGVFDSGIGGLTVVQALMKRFPNENIVYFGDTARVPYGPKSPQVIREYAAQDTEFLVSKSVKMIVVACNTVSSVALDVVMKHARVPVVGVILPGAKAAVAATKKNRVGIIGTAGTIASDAYAYNIHQFKKSIEVISKACPLFVPLVEEGWLTHSATEMIAKEYLFPLKLAKIDTLVLGCTHYPLLKGIIGKIFENEITLIDSGEATSEEVSNVLDQQQLHNPSSVRGNVEFFVSDIPSKFSEIGERFLGKKLGKVRVVSVPGTKIPAIGYRT
ncbi:MAG: glutamate racemase [Bacteroidota bacterium]